MILDKYHPLSGFQGPHICMKLCKLKASRALFCVFVFLKRHFAVNGFTPIYPGVKTQKSIFKILSAGYGEKIHILAYEVLLSVLFLCQRGSECRLFFFSVSFFIQRHVQFFLGNHGSRPFEKAPMQFSVAMTPVPPRGPG